MNQFNADYTLDAILHYIQFYSQRNQDNQTKINHNETELFMISLINNDPYTSIHIEITHNSFGNRAISFLHWLILLQPSHMHIYQLMRWNYFSPEIIFHSSWEMIIIHMTKRRESEAVSKRAAGGGQWEAEVVCAMTPSDTTHSTADYYTQYYKTWRLTHWGNRDACTAGRAGWAADPARRGSPPPATVNGRLSLCHSLVHRRTPWQWPPCFTQHLTLTCLPVTNTQRTPRTRI